jgi:hypothetical protein
MLEGSHSKLDIIINPQCGAGFMSQRAIKTTVSRLQSAVNAAHFSTHARAGIKPFSDDEARVTYTESLDIAATA